MVTKQIVERDVISYSKRTVHHLFPHVECECESSFVDFKQLLESRWGYGSLFFTASFISSTSLNRLLFKTFFCMSANICSITFHHDAFLGVKISPVRPSSFTNFFITPDVCM